MSKIIFLLSLFFGLLFIYPQVYGEVQAAPQLEAIPPQFTNRSTQGVNITASNLIPSNRYFVTVQQNSGSEVPLDGYAAAANPEGKMSFHLCPNNSVQSTCGNNTFQEGVYYLRLYKGKPALANASFTVSVETAGTIEFLNSSFKTTDDITIQVSGLRDGSYMILVNSQYPASGVSCLDAQNGGFQTNLGKYYEGTHNIQIYTRREAVLCRAGSLVTYRSFSINNTTGGGPGTAIGIGTTSPVTGARQCKSKDDPDFDERFHAVCASAGGEPCPEDGRGPAFKTAIGCIHTSPVEFVKDFLKFIIAISGGLAFLMMLLGAFGMLTSAGNPEHLNAGRERLTSAIIGLLFVIFAVLLMQIIGVGILNIPGFK